MKAERKAKDESKLSIDRIYASEDFRVKSVNPKWLAAVPGQDAAYTLIEKAAPDDQNKSIVRYDAATGERTVFVESAALVPPGKTEPLSVQHYDVSADQGRVLIFTNTVRVWRANTRGDYWVLDRGTGQLYQLGGDAPPSSLMYAKFSPNGNAVAYVRDGSLYLEDMLDRSVNTILQRRSERELFGMSDWAYEEEFQLRDAFHWSPDGSEIALWRFDTSNVQDFTMINNTDSLYPTVKKFDYPKAGTRNSDVRIGIYNLQRKTTRWIKLNAASNDYYIPRIQWIDDSGDLLIRQFNRLQNTELIHRIESGGTKDTLVFQDSDEAWLDLQDEVFLSHDKGGFLYLSDRSGWRGMYHVPFDATKERAVTSGDFDVVEILATSQKNVFFIASPTSPTERFLYRVDLSDLSTHRVTPGDSEGVHTYDISPSGEFAVHRYSTTEKPTVAELVSLPQHEVIRTLEDNQELSVALSKLNRTPVEFLQLELDDVTLDAMCMLPPDLDPTKKYPLLVYVYGEPAGSTVVNRFAGNTGLWHQMLAQDGYVVVSIDNRGTDVPRGREFRKSVYRKMGTVGPNDQAAAVKKLLQQRPYLDADRVGVWGWSGGGTSSLHGIFRFPDLYKTAVAVAPVANLRYYDTIYEERYMGLPSANVEGYRAGSAIHFVDQFKGDLLVVHGTADDNVHYQCTELLINEMIAKNKQFDMFIYPGRTHSIRERENTRRHLMNKITDFLKRTL